MIRAHKTSVVKSVFWMATISVCLTSAAIAAPIPPEPLAVPVAGETDMNSFVIGPASDLTVDWMVIATERDITNQEPIPGGGYLYLYQLENTTGIAVDAFSITLGPAGAASIVSGGSIVGDDLDVLTAFHQAHTAANFPVLGPEEEGFPLALLGPTPSLSVLDTSITWTFPPQTPGNQSDTLFYISTAPPTYGEAVAQDSTPPSPWGTLAEGSDQLPIPVPEPAVAGMLAVAAVALLRRRG